MPVTVEKAKFEDALWPAIREIRNLVFIQEQAVSQEEEYDEFEAGSTHFLAFMDGEAAGTARWRHTEKGIKLERFAVKKEFRGKRVGSALVYAVLEDVNKQSSGSEMIYLHAQVQALPFYAGLGFEAYGEEFVEADIIHRKMIFSGK